MKTIYEYDTAEDATRKAMGVLLQYTKQVDKPVIVFDIDDTLIFDNDDRPPSFLKMKGSDKYGKNRSGENKPLTRFLRDAKMAGSRIHLVTARINDADMREYTIQQLSAIGITPSVYETLSLAPDSARGSMEDVSVWKRAARSHISLIHKKPVTLTVGDQWGDVVIVGSNDIDMHDNAAKKPFSFVRVKDSAGLWGLKLPSRK